MPEYYTPEGIEKLKEELEYLKKHKTKEVADLIKETASFGDLSENAAYDDAKEKQIVVQSRIAELEEKIREAEVIKKKQTDEVQIGSTVTIKLDGEEDNFQIVGLDQVDPIKGKISYESPMGKALLGKKEGESLKVEIQGNKLDCKILKIE